MSIAENTELPSEIQNLLIYALCSNSNQSFYYNKPIVLTIKINDIETIKVLFMQGFLNTSLDTTLGKYSSIRQ